METVLAQEIAENPQLVRGRLENGLEYVILPNETPPARFEAHLEVHAGKSSCLSPQQLQRPQASAVYSFCCYMLTRDVPTSTDHCLELTCSEFVPINVWGGAKFTSRPGLVACLPPTRAPVGLILVPKQKVWVQVYFQSRKHGPEFGL